MLLLEIGNSILVCIDVIPFGRRLDLRMGSATGRRQHVRTVAWKSTSKVALLHYQATAFRNRHQRKPSLSQCTCRQWIASPWVLFRHIRFLDCNHLATEHASKSSLPSQRTFSFTEWTRSNSNKTCTSSMSLSVACLSFLQHDLAGAVKTDCSFWTVCKSPRFNSVSFSACQHRIFLRCLGDNYVWMWGSRMVYNYDEDWLLCSGPCNACDTSQAGERSTVAVSHSWACSPRSS